MGGGSLIQSGRTFGSIASFVVLGEPAQVEVLNPWHPPLVLLVVDLLAVLRPSRLPLLLALGHLGNLRLLNVRGHRGWRRKL